MTAFSLNERSGALAMEQQGQKSSDRLIIATIVSVTILAAIAVPIGSKQVSLGVLIPLLCVGLGFWTSRLQLRLSNFMAYAATMSVICGLQIFSGGDFSPLSVLLLAALHLPYCFQLAASRSPTSHIRIFQTVAAFIAACGVCQFLGQFVVDYRWLFPIQTFLPQGFVLQNYNYFNSLFPGSPILKSNGVFMLEASYFSQLAALALIVEILYCRRTLQILLFAAALLVAYSGSGVLVLLIALPIIMIANRRFDILLYALGALILGYLLFDTLDLNLFLSRAHEFTNENSSGFARFVGGFYLFDQYLWPDTTHALFGLGAGAMDRFSDQAHFAAAEVTWVKVVFEYGLIGAVAYLAFQYFCLFNNRGPLAIKLAAAVMLQLNGSLVPFAHALVFALLVWPPDENPLPPQIRRRNSPPRRSPKAVKNEAP